jgi:hypothetical protein
VIAGVELWKIADRVVFEFLGRLAQRQHQRLGPVGRRNAARPGRFLRLDFDPALRVNLVLYPGELAEGFLVGQSFDLVALKRVGELLVENPIAKLWSSRNGSSVVFSFG